VKIGERIEARNGIGVPAAVVWRGNRERERNCAGVVLECLDMEETFEFCLLMSSSLGSILYGEILILVNFLPKGA
jgi:hypothetical protein